METKLPFFTDTKTIGNQRLKVNALVRDLSENQTPYFSVTLEVYVRGIINSCGQQHDLVLEYWPELKPVVDLHLSDIDGVPMYAAENGLYHLGFQSGEQNLKHAASHFRITEERAKHLAESLLINAGSEGYDKEHYNECLRTYRVRWKKEAQRAIELLNTLQSK